ncbi:hypothetical protein FHS15_000459 [Paenibacillus castaneae]|uniref:hypothetical protein n=1 Tax=Paenibacillus castaneae TaxID=474957 RepID=UPI00141B5518|nr:hypothetical protein [Paenibacillus castaneae]NIK75361.1 hypothetical protein [Paenibacillus castaneae]
MNAATKKYIQDIAALRPNSNLEKTVANINLLIRLLLNESLAADATTKYEINSFEA